MPRLFVIAMTVILTYMYRQTDRQLQSFFKVITRATVVAPSLGLTPFCFFNVAILKLLHYPDICFANLKRANLHSSYLRILSSKFKLIWSPLFELFKVFLNLDILNC